MRKGRHQLLALQRLFQLSDEDFDAFEAPVTESAKLKELMKARAPWEE